MLARYLIASLLGVLLNIHVAAFSQEVASGEAKPDETPANADTGAKSEAASSDPAQAAEAKAAFDEKFVAWKAAMNGMNDLRIRYQTADEAGRKRIEADLQTQFKKAQAMIPAMVDAGLKAHEAAPGDDQELTDFLVQVAGFYFRSDRY